MVRSSSSTTCHEQLEAQIRIGEKGDGGQEVREIILSMSCTDFREKIEMLSW
jgi:hypothetical protein